MQGTAAERPPFLFVDAPIAVMVRLCGPWQSGRMAPSVYCSPPAPLITGNVRRIFACQLKPDDSRRRRDRMMNNVQAALAALQRGSLQEAERLLTQGLTVSPRNPDIHQLLGVTHRRMGRHAEAVSSFRMSLELKPGQAEVLNNLGSSLVVLGQFDQAETAYRAAIDARPALAEAHFNLGLLQSRLQRWSAAIDALTRAGELQPGNGKIHEAMCIAFREAGLHEMAVRAGEQAVALQPTAFTAHHNLGQARMSVGDHAGAATAYEQALKLNPGSDVSWIGLGHAFRGLGRVLEARAAYNRAVELNPGNPDAHRLLNEMVWQTGDAGNYLRSFVTTLGARPDDHRLRLSYANELLKIGQNEEAARELRTVLVGRQDDADALDAMARARSGLGDFEMASSFHRRAVDLKPSDPLILRAYVETLLKAAIHAEAHRWTSIGRTRFPLEQGLLAMHTTAQRLVGDTEHARIADFHGISRVMQVEPPPGYADIESFCLDLKVFLEGLHATRAHPTDQTLRGGTQTFGALFQNPSSILQLFVEQLRKSIARYIAEMPDDTSHPLFARKSGQFEFSGSWSVRLSSGGFHTNHFHPQGWISSAFYVDVPDVAAKQGSHAGWLKMGETNLELGAREVIARLIQPRVGSLALFPSYFWHGTVPFESTSPRITIAFDVVPK